MLRLFPYSLIRAGGSFALRPAGAATQLAAEVRMGCSVPGAGWLLDRLIAAVFPPADLRRHMAEEGAALARLLRREP